jgi:hypothetical protein
MTKNIDESNIFVATHRQSLSKRVFWVGEKHSYLIKNPNELFSELGLY